MSAILNSNYEGEKLGNWPHGNGKYTYPDGTYYEGEFYKGEFHGNGKLVYSNGDNVIGKWKNGICVAKRLFFSDGLEYHKNWDYCSLGDRKFIHEMAEGIEAYPDTFVNHNKSKNIPPGTYGEFIRCRRWIL